MCIKPIGLLLLAAIAGVANAQTEVPGGVELAKDDPYHSLGNGIVAGASLIHSYSPYEPAAHPNQDRTKNRETVKAFLAHPIGDENVKLYAGDGIKQIPGWRLQWVGAKAQKTNNDQNAEIYAGWSWRNLVLWDTQDPSTFWVEGDGPAGEPQPAGVEHFIMQFVVVDGKIKFYKEFIVPTKRLPGDK
jgi:hypothetical protein